VTTLLFCGAALSDVASQHDGATLVSLIAEHLAYGRFAGFTNASSE
jgi:hypothetical protein